MKRSLILIAIFALVYLSIPSAAAPAPAKAQDTATITVYITGLTEDTMNWFRDTAFPAFEAQQADMGHPVHMEILTGGWGEFDITVAGWITTGSGPEIVYLGSEYAATYGDLLADLDPYLADWEDLENFLPTALDTASWDGHLRGLPLLMSPRPIFYRTDLLADPSAEPPLTFADALEFYAANSIVENNAMVQMGFMDIGGSLFDAQEFIGYIWSAGGELYYEDGTSAFDSAETAEALQYMYDRRRIMMPSEDTAGLPAIQGYPIASNMVVSGIFPMWNMPPSSDPLWENIAMAPYPAGEGGSPLLQVFIDWLSVPSYVSDDKLPVVVDFLKFICSKDNAIALTSVAGYTPVRQDAWEDLRASNPVWDRLIDLTVEYGRSFSDIRASAQLRPLIVEQVTLFLTDQQSLEDTQEILKEEYDAILEADGYLD
jgi:ABC-type glycerol-3-phosphate transport system substrate-binding protein